MRSFIDTNLWVYRLDRRDELKRRRTADWLREVASREEIVVSTQVLIELRAVLSKKLSPPLEADTLLAAIKAVAGFEVVASDAAMVLDAHHLAVQERLSWFDALIVEAALRSGCQRLYSEDFADGRRYGSLVVVNPLG